MLFESLDRGNRPARVYLSLILFTRSEREAAGALINAQSFWSDQGWQLMPDVYFVKPFFLTSLPFNAEKAALMELFRYRTLSTEHVAAILPVMGDWKGTGTPTLSLISRNGQLMSLCLFDSSTNYNAVVAAQSGSGKSFLANEIIMSYLGQGAQIWVIDIGRSYKKLSDSVGGDFTVFDAASGVCLNPFEMVENYDEETDILVGLVSAMAAQQRPLDDYQEAELKRTMAEAWAVHGRGLSIDRLAEALKSNPDPRVTDVGVQLYSFTSRGEYGRFFAGSNNVSFRSNFTVLELEELQGRKHLQQVVLLQLLYQIQQAMYLGDRSRRKIVLIDEAWSLLTEGNVAKFIEHAYRRFRKYGGSAITLTQSIEDLYGSPAGRSIADNAAFRLYLGQKAETIARVVADKRISVSDATMRWLQTVHTVPGLYSEIFFQSDGGAQGIGRLMVSPFLQLLYSSRPDDVTAIERQTKAGLTIEAAINAVLAERGTQPQ